MAEYYQIPENPQYDPEHIRKLQNSDPGNAEDTFNPLVERILENIAAVHDSGGGGGLYPRVSITAPAGSVITVTDGEKTFTPAEQEGVWAQDLPHYGTWTVTAEIAGGETYTRALAVDAARVYPVRFEAFEAYITVRSNAGAVITCAGGGETQFIISSGEDTFIVYAPGTYAIAQNMSGGNKTKSVAVTTPKETAAVNLRYYLYGYDLIKEDENPDTRVSYPDDVDNAGFTPARMDFGADKFEPGGWTLAPGEDFMPRPCMLKFSGEVAYYLNPDKYSKKIDGTASDIDNINFDGNGMNEWPKIYAKRWDSDDGKIYHFRCSNEKLDDDYECWSNYDINNKEIDHFYTPIFYGSKDSSGRLRSISGQKNWTSTGGAAKVIDAAKLNGADIWYVEVTADIFLIQDLLVTLFKSTDLQSALGNGVSNGSTVAPGTLNDKGMFWGTTANKTTGVKAFGREHSWGHLWYYAAGWVCDHGVQKFKLTRGTKDGTKVTDYNLDGNGYLEVYGATPSGSSGYISSCVTQKFGRVPAVASGTATTYECDGIIMDNTTNAYVYVGGNYTRGDLNGPFCACLQQPPSYSYVTVGGALSCKPLAKA